MGSGSGLLVGLDRAGPHLILDRLAEGLELAALDLVRVGARGGVMVRVTVTVRDMVKARVGVRVGFGLGLG